MMRKNKGKMILAGLMAGMMLLGCNDIWMPDEAYAAVDVSQIPSYTGSPYTVINDNEPDFGDDDFTTEAFEEYSELDDLGRCGVAYANVCKEIMPTEKRGNLTV